MDERIRRGELAPPSTLHKEDKNYILTRKQCGFIVFKFYSLSAGF